MTHAEKLADATRGLRDAQKQYDLAEDVRVSACATCVAAEKAADLAEKSLMEARSQLKRASDWLEAVQREPEA